MTTEAKESSREILSPAQLASEIGVHQATIYRAVASGELRASRLGQHGRAIRVRREDVDRWLVPAHSPEQRG